MCRYLVLTKKQGFRSRAGRAIRRNVTIKLVGPDPAFRLWDLAKDEINVPIALSAFRDKGDCGTVGLLAIIDSQLRLGFWLGFLLLINILYIIF